MSATPIPLGSFRIIFALTAVCAAATLVSAPAAHASEAAQGTFHATLLAGAGCAPGAPTILDFESTFQFDDKTLIINLPPGDNQVALNFSELGVFHDVGQLLCVFDEGGQFASTATNEAGDFTWIGLDGEYLDHQPGISEGDVFPWVAGARCETTRTDEFKTLCDNFELSWNGLSRALAPNPGFNDFAGDLNVRTAHRTHVTPNGGGPDEPVEVPAEVDGDGGSVPDIEVHFHNGVVSEGDLSISTLADAHGEIPHSASFPARGTTEIDHGDGAVPFFEGGDERFIEIHTDAELPSGPDIEVCLPMPVAVSPSDVRPVHVLHGEGSDFGDRVFVDRTSRIDHSTGKACASVSSFSKFTLVTSDVCGNGKGSSNGIVTVAGGLVGRKNVIVDGVTDCADLPPDLPASYAALCVPDADNVVGQCSVSLKLGVDRAGCNEVEAGVDADSSDVNVYSYTGSIRGKDTEIDLLPLFRPALYALVDRTEATVGPVTIALPATGPKTKYKLVQKMYGADPATALYTLDKDALTITCIEP